MPESLLCQNILIADDNDGTREALIAALKAQGYRATGARNGKDAFEKLAQLNGPSLIFMDLMMPVMDGWEVLNKMSSDPAFALNKVVTISAVNPGTRVDAKVARNTVGSLPKPLSFKSVLALVQQFCGEPANRPTSSPAADAHP